MGLNLKIFFFDFIFQNFSSKSQKKFFLNFSDEQQQNDLKKNV
jgi:hypothetical protein